MYYDDGTDVPFEILKGKTLVAICVNREKSGACTLSESDHPSIIFTTSDGESYKLFHKQECCEEVAIDDICGDMNDLLNTPIVVAEEVASEKTDVGYAPNEDPYESRTWTFYRLDTKAGGVTIRWFGASNGYYSERVNLVRMSDAT